MSASGEVVVMGVGCGVVWIEAVKKEGSGIEEWEGRWQGMGLRRKDARCA